MKTTEEVSPSESYVVADTFSTRIPQSSAPLALSVHVFRLFPSLKKKGQFVTRKPIRCLGEGNICLLIA